MPEEVIIGYNDLAISKSDIFDELGYGDIPPGEDVEEAIDEVISQIQPQIRPHYYFEIFDGELLKEILIIQGVEFQIGKIIASQLKKSSKFILFAVTAGLKLHYYLEETKKNNDMLRLYLADCIGSIIAERTADEMERNMYNKIASEGYKHTNRFSPGYCGWHVSEQQKLFSLLPPNVCGITLTDSSLMIPVKSVSGIIGVGSDALRKEYTCNICDYKNCYKRKNKK